ncbi:hypothetical protein C8Q76DRAFT_231445 [Earliella scabrosa]|nr:hypothetical protein C8Q76DRAFT_231445 [Earliella scabrosa]
MSVDEELYDRHQACPWQYSKSPKSHSHSGRHVEREWLRGRAGVRHRVLFRPIEPPTSLLVASRRPFASQILDSTSCNFARCQWLLLPDHCVYLRRTRDVVNCVLCHLLRVPSCQSVQRCNHSGYFYAYDPVFLDRNF